MQRLVDNILAVTKESVKIFTYESLNNVARLINGLSAILLAILPGKGTILEGIHGWELRPTFRGPRFPRWMENGVSSFNKFVHQLSVDSDTSIVDDSTGEDDSNQDVHPAATPSHSLQVSGASRASSLFKYDEWWTDWNRYILSWILFPATLLLEIPFFLYNFSRFRASKGLTTLEHHQTSSSPSALRVQSLKEHFVHRTTDRRRGVIEDLQLAFEIFIEAIFDVVHKATHFFLSPLEAVQILFKWLFFYIIAHPPANSEVSVPTATLGEDNPTPTERTFQQSLNTDARTCQDVITELGYPYEAIRVVTSDGYVLLLERIPRHDARKAVYLQHGILDSSMGWVSNGVVGSPAFAAFDQGYDVFLGNFRGLVSREHVDKNISLRQYWGYSINEHATKDIPAMVEKIHEIKTSELKCDQHDTDGENNDEQPYNLCNICHSLGGAAILMYVITSQIEKKHHRLSRLVLLSPAGFHEDSNLVFSVLEHLVLALGPILEPIVPGLYIPTRFFRMLVNKLARDFHNYPAVGGLVQTLLAYLVGGDSSDWVGVLSLPHYNMNDMPGLSFRVSLHLAQMKRARKFVMYDYGNPHANMEVYGSPKPPDLGEFYGLINIPVHILAGQKDQVIRPSMVKKHYKLMKDSGVEVSYNEFEYAHLDFTFSHSEELLAHVMSRLHLMGSASTVKPVLKTICLKEEDSHVHS